MIRIRLGFDDVNGGIIVLKSLITPADTRHDVNNSCYLQGCISYIDWTQDLDFLRRNINRMRLAFHFATTEFRTLTSKCVDVPWIGHDGRSGQETLPDGTKIQHPGRGVSTGYWDLLPFSGKDTLATIYYYDAARRMADLERAISAHPEWKIPDGPHRFDSNDLDKHAQEIKDHAGKLFWNPKTGRFVAAIDIDGKSHDFGYTFINCEAIYYGFATTAQAHSILDWLSGRRIVAGDTAQGPDIYHWRFAPRTSTVRNLDYYGAQWAAETFPFGGEVEDGGAVLGFSYHDLMARLATLGPDDAWHRLSAITDWFDEVQAEGGYRKYYAKPGRGSLQGGGVLGGLGIDYEFYESVLVPQVMLYGFLGFQPQIDGFSIDPKLPKDWPSLTITRIAIHGLVLDISATHNSVRIVCRAGADTPMLIHPPTGTRLMKEEGALRISKAVSNNPISCVLRKGAVVEFMR
jgi:hypothetical protein